MVWGAMSSAGVGPLCFLRSKVNTAVYQEVLEHFMLPAADQLYGDADSHWQDGAEDGSRVASSGKTLQFFVCFICFFVVLCVRCC